MTEREGIRLECRVCGDTASSPSLGAGEPARYVLEERLYGTGELFDYWQCPSCACLQIEVIPLNLSAHYGDAYYSFESGEATLAERVMALRNRSAFGEFTLVGAVARWFYPRGSLEYLEELRLSGRLPSDARILDVGCGAGADLSVLRRSGYEQVLGVDPFLDSDLEKADGVRVVACELSEIEGEWDLVMFHHSFEHVADPVGLLGVAANLLSPEGVVVIRTPLVDSWAFEHYGRDWIQLDPPRHLVLHSRRSLGIAADRAGLGVSSCVCDSEPFQIWASEQWRRGVPLFDDRSFLRFPWRSLGTALRYRALVQRTRDLNLQDRGDQAVFHLERID